ncbi:c-type cytochrome [Chitinolyticbacter meiyuanensis]|uniref:c-type cytochrome n=1 Tax=Chitinolyticbacter meiyuanensis TaxID=682798 RepID=UPI0011E5B49B|nr:c-type cytochrome [Chitinolyticbacter meiyuanensis]
MRYLIVGWLLVAGWASAADPAKLAAQKACMACHAVNAKIVGPAYADVAKRYKGDKGAAARLAGHIRTGSKGNWGGIAMPPQRVTAEEAQLLAQWVLKQ